MKVKQVIVLHGAGAGHGSDFLQQIASLWQQASVQGEQGGFSYEAHDFPYMKRMQAEGRRLPPDRFDKLLIDVSERLDELEQNSVLLVGKSMGGRVAAALRSHPAVCAAVALGYPFHPIGKPEKLRLEPLESMAAPLLIVQGTRDKFGTREELAAAEWAKALEIQWLEEADHDFNVPKRTGLTQAAMIEKAHQHLLAWLERQSAIA
ncbi:alpha/beta fold hydrolase [Pokkaliibacter sp. CJK22405]|uniref:alpha/beta fold hydrolase n=1 Tax=Pokkaliibacter sp. CJK22405 TaxID=3384615 RepID=UPI0039856A6A